MGKTKAWVQAARLRTLPLSLSGILVGTAMATMQGLFKLDILLFALLTTVGFQITSNFANDYGDGVKGTDNEDRVGPARALQSGLLTKSELKRGIVLSVIISMVLAIVLIYLAFGTDDLPFVLLFFLLGGLSIWAALKYTMGSSPYGYKGLGDLFVFLFFGLLGVLGSMFLYTKALDWVSVLPAMGIGLLCVGVLNLNNLRDVVSDKKHGKITLVVKMGFENGKHYHFLLILMAFLAFLFYIWLKNFSWQQSFFMLAFLPLIMHLTKVMKTEEPRELDSELKKVALSTFMLAVLFFTSVNIFL